MALFTIVSPISPISPSIAQKIGFKTGCGIKCGIKPCIKRLLIDILELPIDYTDRL